jgi:hypothetical protein
MAGDLAAAGLAPGGPLLTNPFYATLLPLLFGKLKAVLRIRDVSPESEFFHTGSWIQGQQDSGSRIRIRIKEFLGLKLFVSSRKIIWNVHLGSRIWIFSLPDPDKKAPDAGSGSAILAKGILMKGLDAIT